MTWRQNKKLQRFETTVGSHLKCPITLDLAVDPVVAADGVTYEKRAIKEWFHRFDKKDIRSPVTRQKMSGRLLHAEWASSAVALLTQHRLIRGAAARKWREGRRHLATHLEAKRGCAMHQCLTGVSHLKGNWLCGKDYRKALHWLEKAAIAGNSSALLRIGHCYLTGRGVKVNVPHGLVIICRCAWNKESPGVRGNAAHLMGMGYFHGKHGLPIDAHQAQKHLELSLRFGMPRFNAKKAENALHELSAPCLWRVVINVKEKDNSLHEPRGSILHTDPRAMRDSMALTSMESTRHSDMEIPDTSKNGGGSCSEEEAVDRLSRAAELGCNASLGELGHLHTAVKRFASTEDRRHGVVMATDSFCLGSVRAG